MQTIFFGYMLISHLRVEISSAENIRKRVELMTAEQNVKTKDRQTEI